MGSSGIKAFSSFSRKQYRLYSEWNMKAKEEPDNLKYQYNAKYYRTRYGMYRKLFAKHEKIDREANAKRYEVEEKKKEEAAIKQ